MSAANFAARALMSVVRRLNGQAEIDRFFSLPHAERVRIVKESYSHETKKKGMEGYFHRTAAERKHEIHANFRPYFDYVCGYTKVVQPRTFMQFGAFLASEAQLLVDEGFEGRILASDYDPQHLEYLKRGFKGTDLERVEFRCVDLEQPSSADFADVEMVAGIAVLSNIQPEGMAKLMQTIEASPVRCMMIGDMYDRRTLGIDPQRTASVPLTAARNWAHPYLALGRKHGFDSHFFPDFTYSSYLDARGVFVQTRGIGPEQHEAAMAIAARRYLGRHDAIWSAYR
jgi:hypothetical protein